LLGLKNLSSRKHSENANLKNNINGFGLPVYVRGFLIFSVLSCVAACRKFAYVVPTSVSVSELLVQPDPIDAFDAHDLLLKLTDIPLPLNISYVDPASRISDDGK